MDEEKLTKAEQKEIRKKERQEWETKLEKEARKASLKKIGWWLLGITVLAATVWILLITSNTSSPAMPVLKAPAVTDSDISTDPKGTKVTFIEYADFQCPGCAHYYPWIKKVLQEDQGKIRYIYRMFPLTQIHKNALISAEAAYAAHLQGKFFPMEDVLFSNQNVWAGMDDASVRTVFISYANQLQLDREKFKKDMDAKETKDFITKEQDAGITAGVNSTPTFFINGTSIALPKSYEEFKTEIEQAMK